MHFMQAYYDPQYVRKLMFNSPEHHAIFRGLSFNSVKQIHDFCIEFDTKRTLSKIQSWTTRVETAIEFSKPNKGKECKLEGNCRYLLTGTAFPYGPPPPHLPSNLNQ